VNALTFARDLARFRELLTRERDGVDGLPAALAASYLHLLDSLAQVGDDEAVAQMVAEAIKVYDDAREPMRRYLARAAGPLGPPGVDGPKEPP
jgi:hypothetical protein